MICRRSAIVWSEVRGIRIGNEICDIMGVMNRDTFASDHERKAQRVPRFPMRAVLLPALLLAELVVIALLFQLATPIECRLTGMALACRALRGVAVSLMCLAALLGVYLWAATSARHALAGLLRAPAQGWHWQALHVLGAVLMLLPVVLIPSSGLNDAFGAVFALLILGGAMAAVGGLFWLAPPAAWWDWTRGRWPVLLMLFLGAALLPMAAAAAGPLWYWQRLTEVTFAGVAVLLWLIGEQPVGNPATQVLGTGDFIVAIADSCSGVEGFALITAFLALYAWLFRDTLRMARFWAVIWPAALLASWLLNVVRIAALVWIGAHVSPDLAVGGFHSFAGWLFFTALALGVLIVASRVRWLHREVGQTPSVPLSGDPAAALIVPFIVFMASGVVAQTFWSDPAEAYPWQVAAMFVALWWARRPLIGLICVPSVLSIGAGLLVGAVWLALAEGQGGGAPALAGAALVVWIAVRVIGTALFVPIIEEAFFRGYVLARIADDRLIWRIGGIAVSSALFALLHGRFVEAGLAGVVFCLVYLHRGRLMDAVISHAVANTVIAAAALWYGDWSLI